MEEKEKVNAAAETPEVQTTEVEAPQAPEAIEAPAAEATEQGPRDLFFERIRTNFPEGKYDEDEEEYYRNANSRFDELERDSKSFHELSDKLMKRLGNDPEEAEIVLDWLDGADIRTASTRHKGAEALVAPEEGAEGYEEWKAAGEARRKELDDMKAQVETYSQNAKESEAALDEFAQEMGLDDEQKAAFANYIAEELLPAIYSGKIGKDLYTLIQRGRNYEADIEGAREQGRVDGRNERIEVGKKHLQGSGLPNGAAGGSAQETEVDTKGNATEDWLSRMAQRRK